MTTIEYDMDFSGGLMDDIRRLVAPPQTMEKSKRQRMLDRQQRKAVTKLPNHDCCDSCKEGGDLLCCDRCSAAFHLQCHDPPLDEDDVPQGLWLCHKCISRPASAYADSIDDETASSCSSRSRQSEMQSMKQRGPTPVHAGNLGTGSSKLSTALSSARLALSLPDGDECFADLEFATDDSIQNPLLLLSAAAKQLNPRQFELPKDLICPVSFPGTSRFGKRRAGAGGRSSRKAIVELENGLVPLPAKLCFACERSCKAGLLLQCDYCPLLFHLDCVNPPLTALPSGRWMCPNHVEHALDERLLSSVRLSERVLLWNQFTGPIDPHAVMVDFLAKTHRPCPPFRLRVETQLRRKATKVPRGVKSLYARAKQEQSVIPVDQTSCDLVEEKSPALAEPSRTTVPPNEQKQWLLAVQRLQSEIAQFLSSNDESASSLQTAPISAATSKPMASVTPQMKSDSSSKEQAEFSSVLTDDVVNINQVADAGSKVQSLPNETLPCIPISETSVNCQIFADNVWRVTNGVRLDLPTGDDSQLLKVTSGHEHSPERAIGDASQAVTDHDNVLYCNSELVSSSRDSLLDNSPLLDRQSDELTAARVLSGIGQLVAVAAATSGLPDSDKTKSVRPSANAHNSSIVGEAKVMQRSRASLHPLSIPGCMSIDMHTKSLTIGTGGDVDVCLTDFGHCNYLSVKHAIVFYDELSQQYELLNYSDYGTTVDGILYACDISAVTGGGSNSSASGGKSNSKKLKQGQARTAASGELDSVRHLISKNRVKRKNCSRDRYKDTTPNCKVAKLDKLCSCDESRLPSRSMNSGWEGSAVLHHGSVIQIGCRQFAFHVEELDCNGTKNR